MEYELTFKIPTYIQDDDQRLERLEYSIIGMAEYMECQMTGNPMQGITIKAKTFGEVTAIVNAIKALEPMIGVAARSL